jgi:cobaltochelatase CobS
MTGIAEIRPDAQIPVRDAFGIDTDLLVPASAEREDHVPEIDTASHA